MQPDAIRRPGVLDHAFALLGAFTPEHPKLELHELSARSGVAKSTTLRLARKLVDLGVLERTNTMYAVGVGLLPYAALAPRGHGLRHTALPYLHDLLTLTGQHVQLTVREGEEAVLVERLSPHGASELLHTVGGRAPLYATGAGIVILAFAPPDVQQEALTNFDPALTDETMGSAQQLIARLDEVRRRGTFTGRQRHPFDRKVVAAPIGMHAGEPLGALSVVLGPETRSTSNYLYAVVATANAIARAADSSARSAG